MKQILTTEQVTENLQRLFPGKDIKCTEAIAGDKWADPQFYIETNTTKLFIIGKMVWVKPSLYNWGNYCAYCNQCGKMYQKLRTKIGTCIPFTTSTRAKDKERYEQIDLLLIACGLKTVKNQDEDIKRLRQYKASDYVNFYKLIKEVEVTGSDLVYEQLYEGYGKYKDGKLMLSVTHTNGKFSFPIECITGFTDQDEQIQNIFFNLLGMATTSKQQIAA